MSVIGRVASIIGVILLIAAIIMVAKNSIDINQLHAVANANRSTPYFNPNREVFIANILTFASGLLLGLGLLAGLGGRRNPPPPAK
jgi:hypothetical protein